MNTQPEPTWDTEETSRIIANDEAMYNRAVRLERNAYSTQRLAYLLQKEFEGAIKSYPYSDIDMDNIEWYSIASEYMEV